MELAIRVGAFFREIRIKSLGTKAEHRVVDSWVELAEVASRCAQHLAKTHAGEHDAIVAFEEEAEAYKRSAYGDLDKDLIKILFKKEELPRRFTKQLDQMLSSMRRVTEHVEIWRPLLGEGLSADAERLLKIVLEMVQIVLGLTKGFKAGQELSVFKNLLLRLDLKEKQADSIRLDAERTLVKLFATAEKRNSAELLAHMQLLDALEEAIDSANRCGPTIEAIASERG